jgi:hypothetical protein
LFCFFTPDNYDPAGPSAYNLDKPGFVQIDTTWILGGALPVTSTSGGLQYELLVQYLRDIANGNWWLYVAYPPNQAIAVGYYPHTLFGAGPLASSANAAHYGGEVTGDRSGQMGSGEVASAGYGHAAYLRNALYYSLAGAATPANLTGLDTAPHYTVDIHNAPSVPPAWETYLYYGGPSFP